LGDSRGREEEPMKGEKTPRREQEAVARLLKVLEEDSLLRHWPEGAEKRARELFPDMDFKKIARRAFREGRAQAAETVEALRKDLGIPTDPSDRVLKRLTLEIESALRRRSWVEVRFKRAGEAVFYVCDKAKHPLGCSCKSKRHLCPSGSSPSVGFRAMFEGGQVRAYMAGGLVVRKGGALLRADGPERVEAALAEARSLPSFLAALGLSDLEGALEVLSRLENGEVRREGPYLLVREGDTRILRRGEFLGSPKLDAAFFLGGRVSLSYPRGLEIALKGEIVFEDNVVLRKFALRFEGEEARHDGTREGKGFSESAAGDLRYWFTSLMRGALKAELEKAPLSPKMRALVEELARSEDPLEAPKDEAFFRRVELKLLTKL
jgi:hypothetical protein